MTEGVPPFIDIAWSLSVFHYIGAVFMPISVALFVIAMFRRSP